VASVSQHRSVVNIEFNLQLVPFPIGIVVKGVSGGSLRSLDDTGGEYVATAVSETAAGRVIDQTVTYSRTAGLPGHGSIAPNAPVSLTVRSVDLEINRPISVALKDCR
jgi:hypothetical protein